jgi:hypothetical protein
VGFRIPSRQKTGDSLWRLLQAVAVVTAVGAPILFSPPPHTDDKNDSYLQASAQLSLASSKVLTLPSPQSLGGDLEYRVEVAARQLRFEAAIIQRTPSSLKRHQKEWRLSGLKRRNGQGAWEELSLLLIPGQNLTASTYVELDNGQNEFQATFRDTSGKSFSYSVWIRRPAAEVLNF